jgi:hypothetical protein
MRATKLAHLITLDMTIIIILKLLPLSVFSFIERGLFCQVTASNLPNFFTLTLPSLEGRAGEAWEHFKKRCPLCPQNKVSLTSTVNMSSFEA